MTERVSKIIRTPSAQHLAYHVDYDRKLVAKRIKETYEQTGRPTYNPTRAMLSVILRTDQDDDWVRRQIDVLAQDSTVWREAIAACELLLEYRRMRRPAWFRKLPPRMFQLPTGLVAPVNPAGLLRADGAVSIVWTQLWKTKSLAPHQLAFLFEVLKRSYFILELEDAKLDFVDLGRRPGERERSLRVSGRDQMPSITETDFRTLCTIFHEELDRFMSETGRPRPGAPEDVEMGIYPPLDDEPSLF